MAEFNNNLWAPWRMDYIRSLSDEQQAVGCFLCAYRDHPEDDQTNHVVWRGERAFVVMNRFPYTNGHLLIASNDHTGKFDETDLEALAEISAATRDAVRLLRKVVRAEGFNVGFNIGRCAGAGLPDHLHAHVVPRWSGDTNFMAVLDQTRVVPDSLDALWTELRQGATDLGFGKP